MPSFDDVSGLVAEACGKLGIDFEKVPNTTVFEWHSKLDPQVATIHLEQARMSYSAAIDGAQGDAEKAAKISEYTAVVTGIVDALASQIVANRQSFPVNPTYAVFSIFEGAAHWRVYVLPLQPNDRPARYQLAYDSRSYGKQSMTLETFVSEIVSEYARLAAGRDVASIATDRAVALLEGLAEGLAEEPRFDEDDRETLKATNPPLNFLGSAEKTFVAGKIAAYRDAAEALRDGEHLEGGDEAPEAEEPAAVPEANGAATAAPVATA